MTEAIASIVRESGFPHFISPCGRVVLACCDSLELLPRLPAGAIDAIVADPPYGISHVKGAGGRGAHNRRNFKPIHGDDRPFDPRPLTDNYHCLLWGANHFRDRLPPGGRFLAWDKLCGNDPWDSFSDVEFAWHSKGGASRIVSYLWKGIANAKDECDSSGGVVRLHPSQKPIRVMEWCIEQVGEAPTICDPYLGSGSTALACIRAGRAFLGIEIDPGYFEIAVRRIKRALADERSKIRFPVEPVPVQGEMFGEEPC